MAKILFIKCAYNTGYHQNITFPLGLMSMAAVLQQEGHDVRILDLRLDQEQSHSRISAMLRREKRVE